MTTEDGDSTIETGFQMLKSHLEITEDQRSVITACQGELEKVIAKNFETYGTMLLGAYSRDTMIAVKKGAIVDLYLVLRPEYGHEYTSGELVNKLHEALVNHYEEISHNIDGHGVIVPLSDFQFNIVPCFYKIGKGYVIPYCKKDQWITTNPNTYLNQLKQANKSHDGHLLPLIKIIKCWNQKAGNMFDEYYLELLVCEILTDVEIKDYTSAVKYIFKEARHKVVFKINDPAGFGQQVKGVKDAERLAEAMIGLHEAYKATLNAEVFEHEGELDLAYKEWESIFTGYFPKPFEMLAQELEGSGIEGAKALKILMDRTH